MNKNLTKKRMADAFRHLMDKKAFSAISISDICDECGMHRKSFYYHFKDKYDLVAWIYDNETDCTDSESVSGADVISRLEWLMNYLYENREYYSKLLQIEGQNSFGDHFSRQINAAVEKIFSEMFPGEKMEKYQVDFVSQGIAAMILQWIKDKEDCTPEQTVEKIVKCYKTISRIREKM